MKKLNLLVIGALAFALQNISTQAQLIESWENTTDGWTISPFGSAGNQANFQIAGFSSTQGVTDGSFSLAVGPTAGNSGSGPDYSQLLISPASTLTTSILGNAASLSFDVYTPPASFGFFLQFDLDINNTDTGFVSLDGFSYPSTTIGSETTFTLPISSALRSTLSTSVNPTTIILQVGGGFSAGNETMYLDNLRATPAPEPATMTLFGLGALGLLKFARRRNS